MLNPKDITPGSYVKGLIGTDPVKIIAVNDFGSSVLEVVYKDSSGTLGNRLLYGKDYADLELAEADHAWSFNGDGNLFKLTAEAYRISLAYIFDPYLAVHTSEIEPLPHQISAVYQEMLPRLPLRYVLADDPGAGKTIMAGLFLKELLLRGELKHCLVVSPGSLAEQWQDELRRKFKLNFKILEDKITTGLYIARMDKLARNKELQASIEAADWDVIVIDEAHKMSASVWGDDIKTTKRFELGRILSRITRHLLLITATPHNGHARDFQLFMSLIDTDRYEGAAHSKNLSVDVSGVMRRLLKEELRRFDGTPLFPERIAYTADYELSPLESELYNDVTEYVRKEFNRADKLKAKRKNTIGFALTILQRRLASSPEAIYQSLKNRRERLEERLRLQEKEYFTLEEDYDEDDDISPEQTENEAVDYVSAADTNYELEEEIKTLRQLEEKARTVKDSGEDRKWQELSQLLQGNREKLIIFTEHKATLFYLLNRIKLLLGDDRAAIAIHGGMSRDERIAAEYNFKNDNRVIVLIATDAAGEGINLQNAHLMVNYDLPWNPNRIEQRFGRIHRIGQTEVCHLWNLVASNTREGAVFHRLFTKLETERKALGGKVFDILGRITYGGKSLNDLLIEAIRYGNSPEVRDRLNKSVDNSLERESLIALLNERALTEDTIDITRIRKDLVRTNIYRLQPHFIGSFFIEAFRHLGGSIHERERGRYEITFVPNILRSASSGLAERICFDKEFSATAELIAPGKPLLDSVVNVILGRHKGILRQGTVLIDDNTTNTEARILFFIEDSIQDGTNRIISKHIHFIEITSDGQAANAGNAPYLNYRPASPDEQEAALAHYRQWLNKDIEAQAVNFAVEKIVPGHLQEVCEHKLSMLNKTYKAVKNRLKSEIFYWDCKALELSAKKDDSNIDLVNYQRAQRRAEDLAGRMKTRLEEIEHEKNISALPPVIIGGALVIPASLLKGSPSAESRKAIELSAMRAVMDIERTLGYIPHDVSALKCGYDIESGNGDSVRFIEVKGRVKGADTVTVTAGEIKAALNSPDNFILALVEVDGNNTRTIYLKRPFTAAPDFSASSVNYNIDRLLSNSECIYTEER